MAKYFFKKGFIYVYNWVTLLDSRDGHNTVNQLYFNEKKKLKKKKPKTWQYMYGWRFRATWTFIHFLEAATPENSLSIASTVKHTYHIAKQSHVYIYS